MEDVGPRGSTRQSSENLSGQHPGLATPKALVIGPLLFLGRVEPAIC